MDEASVNTLYIMGYGRSGSTFLDIVLGNHADIQGLGELTNVVGRGWGAGGLCSCGERANRCPFWAKVRQRWNELSGRDDAERYYPSLQEKFEWYSSLPRLLLERRKPSSEFREYARLTSTLLEAVRAVGDKPIVVDSSKSPIRALALFTASEVDLCVVHLVRDGRGVAASLDRSWRKDEKAGITRDIKARPVWRTALFWALTNLISGWVRRRLGSEKAFMVRYDDLVSNPPEVLGEIGCLTKPT